MLSVTFYYTYAVTHYVECRYAECCCAKWRYAKCCYTDCRYAECLGALKMSGQHPQNFLRSFSW
jgi:hypothetical protein